MKKLKRLTALMLSFALIAAAAFVVSGCSGSAFSGKRIVRIHIHSHRRILIILGFSHLKNMLSQDLVTSTIFKYSPMRFWERRLRLLNWFRQELLITAWPAQEILKPLTIFTKYSVSHISSTVKSIITA